MTTTGLIVVIVVVAALIAALAYDKKKADQRREVIDAQNGKHDADFSNGYIANNTLYMKDRVKGYLELDLSNVRKATLYVDRNHKMNYMIIFLDGNSKRVKSPINARTLSEKNAKEVINAVCSVCSWIVRE